MFKCSTSLWSADLMNLESEIRRVEPYSDRFHVDVADGHYTSTLLFFPDLIAQIRPHTNLPLEAHLMVRNPIAWVEPFSEAGIDVFILCYDTLRDVAAGIDEVKRRDKKVGISLRVDEPVDLLEPYWQEIDLVTIIGTPIGVKGASLDASIPDKIREARRRIEFVGASTEIQADGGIRRHTIRLLVDAGADWIVPGSLMFNEDPAEIRRLFDEIGIAPTSRA